MIKEAKKRNNNDKITYLIEDANKYLSKDKKYDLIISVATLHHMDFEDIIIKCKEALHPKGIFIILDLYKSSNIKEYLLSVISVLLNPIYNLIKRRRINNAKEEKEAWDAHSKSDKYNTIREIKNYADRILGNYLLKRQFKSSFFCLLAHHAGHLLHELAALVKLL